MGDDRLDKRPGEVGDHITCIAACQGRDLQIDAEDDQQNNCHCEGRDISEEDGYRQQNLIKALAQVCSHCAQDVAQDPADQNGGQLQGHRPADGGGEDVAHLAGVLTEGFAEIAMEHILDEHAELDDHGLVGAELLLIVLVNFTDGGGVGHTGGQLAGDGGNGVGRHQPGQDEIENDGKHQRDEEPQQLLAEVFSVTFHLLTLQWFLL